MGYSIGSDDVPVSTARKDIPAKALTHKGTPNDRYNATHPEVGGADFNARCKLYIKAECMFKLNRHLNAP
jgi:hypothetical protein